MKISGAYVRGERSELIYYELVLDSIHEAFESKCPSAMLQSSLPAYYGIKEGIDKLVRTAVVSKVSTVFSTSFGSQNWMDFHKSFRARKPTNAQMSIECEGIFAAWMMLQRCLRSVVYEYMQRKVNPRYAVQHILSAYVDFFMAAYQVITLTPVSVQQAQLFCDDLKLCLALMGSIQVYYSNVTLLDDTVDTCYLVRVWSKPSMIWKPRDIVLVSKRFSSVRSALANLHKTMVIGPHNIDQSLAELTSSLAKNRKAIAGYSEVYKKSVLLAKAFRTEAHSNTQDSKDLAVGVTVGYRVISPIQVESEEDTDRHYDNPALSSSNMNLLHRDEQQQSGFMLGSSSSMGYLDQAANSLFEETTAFTFETKLMPEQTEDIWVMAIDKLLGELGSPDPPMMEELVAIASMTERQPAMPHEKDSLLRLSKRKDDFMKRPELLDPDKDLKSSQLLIKHKVKQLL